MFVNMLHLVSICLMQQALISMSALKSRPFFTWVASRRGRGTGALTGIFFASWNAAILSSARLHWWSSCACGAMPRIWGVKPPRKDSMITNSSKGQLPDGCPPCDGFGILQLSLFLKPVKFVSNFLLLSVILNGSWSVTTLTCHSSCMNKPGKGLYSD